MYPTIGIFALFVFGGLFTYTISERHHRLRWWRIEQRPDELDGHDPFRCDAGPTPTRAVVTQQRAPRLIRRTALWSIYMGQMAVPGGLLGLIGLPFWGLGLVSIPGMILAVRIWRLAYAMLRRDPGAAPEARALHRFALSLNAVAMTLGFVLGAIDPHMLGLTAVLWAYGAVSIAHALALRSCAERLELEQRVQDETQAAKRSAQVDLDANIGYVRAR